MDGVGDQKLRNPTDPGRRWVGSSVRVAHDRRNFDLPRAVAIRLSVVGERRIRRQCWPRELMQVPVQGWLWAGSAALVRQTPRSCRGRRRAWWATTAVARVGTWPATAPADRAPSHPS